MEGKFQEMTWVFDYPAMHDISKMGNFHSENDCLDGPGFDSSCCHAKQKLRHEYNAIHLEYHGPCLSIIFV